MVRIITWIAAAALAFLVTSLALGAEIVWPTSWRPEQTELVGAMESVVEDENGEPVWTMMALYRDHTVVRFVEDRPVTVVFENNKACSRLWIDVSAIKDTPTSRVIRVGEWGSPQWERWPTLDKTCKYTDADPGFSNI